MKKGPLIFNAVLLGGLGLFEASMALVLAHPALLPWYPFRALARDIYQRAHRTTIQYEEACARYDGEVTYTLRPGEFRFANVEFDTGFRVNSAGLRDDEADLVQPEVIVLGDSMAMGWGVEQHETYAERVQAASGLKVLNAGISSYGTVRELMMLNRLDTSRLRALVIHYMDNDARENRSYYAHGGRLPVMSEAEFENIRAIYRKQKRYVPGKYWMMVFKTRLWAAQRRQEEEAARSGPDEAQLVVRLLRDVSGRRLDGVRILVVDGTPYAPGAPRRAELFPAALAAEDLPAPVRQLTVLTAQDVVRGRYRYVLDDHWTPLGHQQMAEALLAWLNEGSPLRDGVSPPP